MARVGRFLLVGYLAVISLTLGFGVWAALTQIEGAIVAQGTVEVEHNRQAVQHPDGGVIAKILVSDGDQVRAGEILIQLSDSELAPTLANVEMQALTMQALRARLIAEMTPGAAISFPEALQLAARSQPEISQIMAGQMALLRSRRLSRAQWSVQNARRQDQLTQQSTALMAQLNSLRQQQEMLQNVGQAPSETINRTSVMIDGQIAALQAQQAQLAEQMTQIEIEHIRQEVQERDTVETLLRSLDTRTLELTERQRILRARIERLSIRAPVSGVIHEMAFNTPQAVIRPADPILYLIPQDRPFLVNARISPNDVDEVSAGQTARLRVSAFSGRNAPELVGQVARISPDALRDIRTGQPYYRAEIIPSEESLGQLAEHSLIPGMPVEVYLRTQDRTPLSYLAAPLIGYFRLAFRES
ncbi:hypothetical protein BFP70_17550 [Thioclava sp. SK-1]|nr:hypothetical protein BFP70_17550 [Thioclava sp. SK-1]